MGKTQIDWGFDSFETWNPQEGCTRVSPGCEHCYAEKYAGRFCEVEGSPLLGIAKRTPSGSRWTGKINLIESRLNEPLRRRKPTVYFVNSRSDTFHEKVPANWIDRLFVMMALSRQHRFLVLTKRADRMMEWAKWRAPNDVSLPHLLMHELQAMAYSPKRDQRLGNLMIRRSMEIGGTKSLWPKFRWPLPNVGLGVSVENKKELRRIDVLRDTPAAFRFLSLEPLLEDLGELDLQGIDWVIVGGESGHGARRCLLSSVEHVIDACKDARVPCFVKQLGRLPAEDRDWIGATPDWYVSDSKGGNPEEWPEQLRVRQIPEGFLRSEAATGRITS